uniref:Agmatinase n=1 Tax=Catharus ustulatus TaxID=91951 RepID=A0A8C3U6B1_CATUS
AEVRLPFWSRAPSCWSSGFNVPPSAQFVARPVGVCSMMKLPMQASAAGLDVAFVGVPLDTGTSNRPGARFGPRQIRAESAMLRRYNSSTGAAPFDSLRVADIGDVNSYQDIVASGCVPLTLGKDRTNVATVSGAGTVPWDWCTWMLTPTPETGLWGRKIYHGSTFRRCVDEGLLDCGRVVQIGIRGSSYEPNPYKYCREQGFRVVPAEECWMKSLEPLMREVRAQLGDKPMYISFDIDGAGPRLRPGHRHPGDSRAHTCAGEGGSAAIPTFLFFPCCAPFKGGCSTSTALEIIRGCKGLNIVGCDLVEVAPMYDVSGNTALLGANLLFEMLCVLPGVKTM